MGAVPPDGRRGWAPGRPTAAARWTRVAGAFPRGASIPHRPLLSGAPSGRALPPRTLPSPPVTCDPAPFSAPPSPQAGAQGAASRPYRARIWATSDQGTHPARGSGCGAPGRWSGAAGTVEPALTRSPGGSSRRGCPGPFHPQNSAWQLPSPFLPSLRSAPAPPSAVCFQENCPRPPCPPGFLWVFPPDLGALPTGCSWHRRQTGTLCKLIPFPTSFRPLALGLS